MREAGLDAEGQVGDADPVAAVSDVCRPGEFDEIVVATLPAQASKWLLVDVPHRLERLTDVPVRHVVAEAPKPPPRTARVHRRERLGIFEPLVAAWPGRRRPPDA